MEEEPSEPTGVRIDINKMNLLHSDLVRATDGYTVERLDRCYTILAKVGYVDVVSIRGALF